MSLAKKWIGSTFSGFCTGSIMGEDHTQCSKIPTISQITAHEVVYFQCNSWNNALVSVFTQMVSQSDIY